MTLSALIRRAQRAQEMYDHRNAVQLSIASLDSAAVVSPVPAAAESSEVGAPSGLSPPASASLSTSGPDPSALGVAQPCGAASGPAFLPPEAAA